MGVAFIHLIHFPVRALGPGIRVGVWFQGCSLHCPGCVTPESWGFGHGGKSHKEEPNDRHYIKIAVSDLAARIISFFGQTEAPRPIGLTISGGEPFDQPKALLELLGAVRAITEDILIYSGYSAERLAERHPKLPGLAAALVDGPFEQNNLTNSVWKGSDNQRLTLWNERFSERYGEWARGEKRRLQLVMDAGRVFFVGIPRQEDVELLKDPLL
ncbi:MAG: radical SAM protein [Synergistaceae bacterium]|jgi:anaerobic ribonucleoside-triphosphate reductase activating protein|nr:radical SAM protein [Synergistaceae bacterium]